MSIPFLKWAGGKRWLAAYVSELLPSHFENYIEPFLGSAAMFGAIKPTRALLSDVNEELINTYLQVCDDPAGIEAALQELQGLHSDLYYYAKRAESPTRPLERAARFIYLNRTCFNGIYRVNQRGQFNVPRGTKNSVVLPNDDFASAAQILARAKIACQDFEVTISKAQKGDLVFCDPPYTVAHNNNGFVRYNEQMFSWNDQVRLKEALVQASSRGALVLLTNAAHESIRSLYEPSGFTCIRIGRQSVIGGGNQYRGSYAEYLIANYPLRLFGPELESANAPQVALH